MSILQRKHRDELLKLREPWEDAQFLFTDEENAQFGMAVLSFAFFNEMEDWKRMVREKQTMLTILEKYNINPN